MKLKHGTALHGTLLRMADFLTAAGGLRLLQLLLLAHPPLDAIPVNILGAQSLGKGAHLALRRAASSLQDLVDQNGAIRPKSVPLWCFSTEHPHPKFTCVYLARRVTLYEACDPILMLQCLRRSQASSIVQSCWLLVPGQNLQETSMRLL